jgi:phosphoribosylanthranilate isomerase
VTVKVCGLTNAADAEAAVRSGADYLGFVFFPASARCLGAGDHVWVEKVAGARKVGVFRDQGEDVIDEVSRESGLDMVQLHGAEPPELCERLGGRDRVIKAIPVSAGIDWRRVEEYAPVARLLFDTETPTGGGSGRSFDWRLLSDRPDRPALWLAGGLRPDNVGEAIRLLRPEGVDVASGVEQEIGRKDAARMLAFVAAVRAGEGSTAAGGGGGRDGR